MADLTKAEIAAKIIAYVLDNTLRRITPAQMREILGDLNDSTFNDASEIIHNDLDGLNDGDFQHLSAVQLEQLVTIIGLMSGVASNVQNQLNNKVNSNSPNATPGTYTKATFDAKGLFLSGAVATTADIISSTDKRYVTDSNLLSIARIDTTISGNPSIIGFAYPTDYGTSAIPLTISTFTDSLGTAIRGLKQKIYHNSATAPTFPSNWVKISGEYIPSTLNIIEAYYSGTSTRVEYSYINDIYNKVDKVNIRTDFSNISNVNYIANIPAVVSYVATQIANLINSAPATLDTLNEIATALGNDPNFATTITTLLAGKQSTLISGTNIKTLNGNNLLGSGNIILGLTNFIEAQQTTGVNATIYANSLTAVSSSNDADFIVKPKGAGAFIVGHVPLGGDPTDGNKRGLYAVDIQPSSVGWYTSVASGNYSVSIGYRVYSSGLQSVAIGSNAWASATYAMALVCGPNNGATGANSLLLGSNGDGNCNASGASSTSIMGGYASGTGALAHGGSTASGTNAVALGGSIYSRNVASGPATFATNANTYADANGSSSFGAYSRTKGVPSRISLGSFQDVAPYLSGSAQLSLQSVMQQSTSATAVEMTTYSGTAIALIMQDNESIRIKGSIIGRQSSSLNTCSYDFDCLIVRGVGASTTVIRVNNMNLFYDDITVTTLPSLLANTAYGGLSIKTGGKAATTIRWSARIDSVETILA